MYNTTERYQEKTQTNRQTQELKHPRRQNRKGNRRGDPGRDIQEVNPQGRGNKLGRKSNSLSQFSWNIIERSIIWILYFLEVGWFKWLLSQNEIPGIKSASKTSDHSKENLSFLISNTKEMFDVFQIAKWEREKCCLHWERGILVRERESEWARERERERGRHSHKRGYKNQPHTYRQSYTACR